VKEKMKTKFNKIFINILLLSFLIIPSAVFANVKTQSTTFSGLYNGAGLVRNCPSFNCKIIKYGGICPTTEVLRKENNWYKVKFTVRGIYKEGAMQIDICGDKDEKILPKSSWVTYEGWMPESVIPPRIRGAVIDRKIEGKKEIASINKTKTKESMPAKGDILSDSIIQLHLFVIVLLSTFLLGVILIFFWSRKKKVIFSTTREALSVFSIIILLIVIGGVGFFTYKSYKQQKLYQQEIENLKMDTQRAIKKVETGSQLRGKMVQETVKETQRKIKTIEKREKERKKQLPNQSIALIKKWAPSIVKLTCSISSNRYSQGSGTLFYNSEDGSYTVFTNYHVVATGDGNKPFCIVTIYPNSPLLTGALAYMSDIKSFKYFGPLDMVAFNIRPIKQLIGSKIFNKPLPNSLSPIRSFAIDGKNMNLCGIPQIGEKVFILGYPAIGGDSLTVTDGIIAGIENKNIKYYKTSAKIEHGNSGGAAILEKGCLLGIPTLAVLGKVESLAYILPFQ